MRRALSGTEGVALLSGIGELPPAADAPCVILAEDEAPSAFEDLRLVVASVPSAPVLCAVPLNPDEALAYESLCGELGIPALCCAVIGPYASLGTPGAVLCCAGEEAARRRVAPVLDALGGARDAGERACMTAVTAHAVSGTHYVPLLSLLVGAGMCERYGLELDEFAEKVVVATPDLAQGAWRNICSGINDERAFDDVDDDIHAMEMLVALLKRTGAARAVARDHDAQRRLNRLVSRHWSALAGAVLGERDECRG